MAGCTAWLMSDGKMGDLAQCRGVAGRLGLSASERVVRPRAIFAALGPWGPVDPAEWPGRPGSPLRPPFPQLVIASGRRT